MNVPTWVAWILVAILAIVCFYSDFYGQGSFFNSWLQYRESREKNKYNINTLSKVAGGGLGVLTGITALIVLYNASYLLLYHGWSQGEY